ncbi:MAG: VOC family protein [Saprospiraceae bacterium]|nr:VOC family protein [Saprospiraceae bacterium]
MANFQIQFLDHVAIRVADLEKARRWYIEVLGLKPYQKREWGPFPIFLLAGKTGVALFPADPSASPLDPSNKGIKIDHFAFQLDQENFSLARQQFDAEGIPYDWQDHHYFHSIYLRDPDGHKVELTTLIGSEADFYGAL